MTTRAPARLQVLLTLNESNSDGATRERTFRHPTYFSAVSHARLAVDSFTLDGWHVDSYTIEDEEV